ncbi:MAG: TfuA-like protein [Burkholderiales bacterium]
MNCCIFAGPTLREADRARFPEALWLPPAKQGDIYRVVALLQPRFIGLVDGYFQWVPAVWHKEILWAIGCGIHVFGAGSMGALRAAELAPYGMHGIGSIFAAYRSGVLPPFEDHFEDDDEVAVVHGPKETGYLAASEAMVNIRMTLAAAAHASVIGPQTLRALVAAAKALYFPERSYERVVCAARAQDLPAAELDALEAFLPHGRIDQKRADAIELIEALRAFRASDPEPGRAHFRFEHTTLWDRVVRSLAQSAPHEASDAQVLAEVRLEGFTFLDLSREVLAALADPGPRQEGGDVPAGGSQADLAARARLHAVGLDRERIPGAVIERHLLQRLRDSGRYSTLLARAADKRDCLRGQPVAEEVSSFDGIELLSLEDWYFERCLGTEIPDDLAGHIAQLGYPDRRMFHEAIFAEYLYRRIAGGDGHGRTSSGATDNDGIS